MPDTLHIDIDPDTRADLCRLDHRGEPYRAHLHLDLVRSSVTVEMTPPHETGIPIAAWNGVTRRYRLPEAVDALALAAELEDGRPLRAALERLCAALDDITRDRDGRQYPTWDEDPRDIEQDITETIERLPVFPGGIWTADAWLQHGTPAEHEPRAETWERLFTEELERLHCDEEHAGPVACICCDFDPELNKIRLYDDRADVVAPPAVILGALLALPDGADCGAVWEALRDLSIARRAKGLQSDTTDEERDALARALVDEALADGAAVVGMAEYLTEARGRLRGESVQYVELIEKVEAAVAGWSDWDWAQPFADHDYQTTIDGPVDDEAAIAHLPADTQGAILDYQIRVRDSVERAHEHAAEAIDYLRLGNLSDALGALRAAADEERTWGDDPVWGPVVVAAEHLAATEQGDAKEPPRLDGLADDMGLPIMAVAEGDALRVFEVGED